MLYTVSLFHDSTECPGNDADTMKELASRFSVENLSRKNIKILDAYIDRSCILHTKEKVHLSTFVLETDSSVTALTELFRPMNAEIRPVINWQSFWSKLRASI